MPMANCDPRTVEEDNQREKSELGRKGIHSPAAGTAIREHRNLRHGHVRHLKEQQKNCCPDINRRNGG